MVLMFQNPVSLLFGISFLLGDFGWGCLAIIQRPVMRFCRHLIDILWLPNYEFSLVSDLDRLLRAL